MEVILLQKVANLGNIGDKVKVKPGYGRNFLLPSGRAALATAANLKKFEERRSELEKLAADSLTGAQARAKQLEGFTLALQAKAGWGAKQGSMASASYLFGAGSVGGALTSELRGRRAIRDMDADAVTRSQSLSASSM